MIIMPSDDEHLFSAPPVPEEAFEKCAGQYVSLHDGEVLAHADTMDELMTMQRYDSSYALFRVPDHRMHYYSSSLSEQVEFSL